jgi:AcrR family transcriptional regulator
MLCNNFEVPRRYELKERAERQDRTRQRIVEAAVALHTSIGPARTTVSAIAERAGVQRHTFYRHFPDERSLALACSGLHFKTHPLPDPQAWRSVEDPDARVRLGVGELYRYYERNAGELTPIIRDVEVHPLTQEILTLRFQPAFDAMCQALLDAFKAKGATRRRLEGVLVTLLTFTTWRQLRAGVRSHAEAVDAAARAIAAQVPLRPSGNPR